MLWVIVIVGLIVYGVSDGDFGWLFVTAIGVWAAWRINLLQEEVDRLSKQIWAKTHAAGARTPPPLVEPGLEAPADEAAPSTLEPDPIDAVPARPSVWTSAAASRLAAGHASAQSAGEKGREAAAGDDHAEPDTERSPPPLPPLRTGNAWRSAASASTDDQDLAGRMARAVWRFFTEGNAPVKVGILVLLAGVGAFLKYAVDQEWLRMPPEFRLIGIALAAVAALVFGWRQRASRPVFALSLQGGAIGVLYLCIYAALRLYQLLPAEACFFLLVAVAVLGLVLAVRQDSQLLAAFAAIGGFAAPILASTGSGNFVALFGYYAVLNAGVFAAAWVRAWRGLNLIGFFATFGVGLAWGAQYYAPQYFASVEPFLVLFFAFYVAVGYLYALKRPTARGLWVDSVLVFGTPLVAFGLQAALLDGDDVALAWSAVVVALVHLGLAFVLWKRAEARTLQASYSVLGFGFAAVAVPLGLGASWTASVWALQGAALIWLSLQQTSSWLRYAGSLLILGAGLAWMVALDSGTGLPGYELKLASGALCWLAGAWVASYLLDRAGRSQLSPLLYGYGWLAFLAYGLHRLDDWVLAGHQAHALLAMLGVAALLAEGLRQVLAWSRSQIGSALALMLSLPAAIFALSVAYWPLEAQSAAFLALWLLGIGIAVRRLDEATWSLPAHFCAFLAFLLLAIGECWYRSGHDPATGLSWWAASLPALLLAALEWRRPGLLCWPRRDADEGSAQALRLCLLVLLGGAVVLSLASPGEVQRLRYLPVLNPLELMQLASLLALAVLSRRVSIGDGNAEIQSLLRGGMLLLSFVALSVAVARAVHHYAAVPWSFAIVESQITQSAISIVWTAIGIGAMLLGSRRVRRPLWIAGATLVAVVVLKLLVIDRNFLGDLAGIVAFLGVGALLVAVGYFAPVPPRESEEPR